MSIATTELAAYLDELLNASAFKDYCHNGIQISGAAEVSCIASSASASLEVCQQAVSAQADALLVHHGIIWGSINRVDGLLRDRIQSLLGANCNLLAYHLPLDADPVWGNNSKALELLGLTNEGSFGAYHGNEIGRWGLFEIAISPQELAKRCETAFQHAIVHCPGGPESIQKVGIITGGGQSSLLDAHAAGLDAFITGEASEQTWHEAAESGCHCFACGHYATECHAVHALAAHLAEKFGLKHLKIDQANPI